MSGLDDLMATLADLSTKKVKAGFFDTSKYADGTPVATVAVSNEFGVPSKKIPERAFMRPALRKNSTIYTKIVTELLGRGLDAEQIADNVGLRLAGDIAQEISDFTSPALSQRTIAARVKRGNSNTHPLTDTMLMFDSVLHEVSNGD
jgi:hypothetical protein